MPAECSWQWSLLCSNAVQDASMVQRHLHASSASPTYLIWLVGSEVSGSSQSESTSPASPSTPSHETRQHPVWPFSAVGPK